MKKIITILLIIIFSILSYTPSYFQEVRFTSYHPNDKTGSTKCTASGYCTKNFDVNDEGMYTYNDMIVIATAVKKCTDSKTGVCSNYNYLPKGYNHFNLYDKLKLEFNNKKYDAIVLDICGACYWEEEYQRYDIFVLNKAKIIDAYGTVLIKERINYYSIVLVVILLLILLAQFKIKNFKSLKNIYQNRKNIKTYN